MRIADIHTAKRSKIKMSFVSKRGAYQEDKFLSIKRTSKETEFFVEPFGGEGDIFRTDLITASLLDDLLLSEEQGVFRSVFIVEGMDGDGILVQAYSFHEIKEYKTPIYIKVSETVLEKNSLNGLREEFVWEGLGSPAIFSLSYKDVAKRKDIRLLSNKRMLKAENTVRGIIAKKAEYARDRTALPICMFLAPNIEFVSENEACGSNDEFSHDLKTISSAETYFARWEAYNVLAEKQIQSMADEFGKIAYKEVIKTPTEKGTLFEFTIGDDVPVDFLNSPVAVLVESFEGDRKPHDIRVGDIKEVVGKKMTTFLADTDDVVLLPKKGTIVLSIYGDEVIINRRNKAKARMLSGQSPIKSIVKLIEEGISEFNLDSNWGESKAVTEKLRKNFTKAKDLNERQKKALELAINTPDIALIQGPPGTGKTTVIKAICERFREVFEAKQRQNDEAIIVRPEILITSFQNEAVDNAISKPSRGDMPAYRIGKKDKIRNQYMKSLEDWYDGVRSILESDVKNVKALVFSEERRKLADEFFSYKNGGELIESAIKIIKKYLAVTEITYPELLKNTANAIVKEYQKRVSNTKEIDDPIIAKLNSQRLTKEAYLDDGKVNAMRLSLHIKNRDDLIISDRDRKAIAAVLKDEMLTSEVFNKYVDAVKRLKIEFCSEQEQVDIFDKERVEKVLLELSNAYLNGYLSLSDDLDTKKSLIIGEFLNRLENEYESLVSKYSLTTAATCQTSLQFGNSAYKTYELVIVDEAARANPLDLFIPMSMGRKIILVGDQKQLPHMLEPEVLKLILEDPLYKDLPGIEVSLFERLYEMFKEGLRPKAIMLNKQYRMSPDICKFVSEEFYDGELISDDEFEASMVEERAVPLKLFNGNALGFVDISLNHGEEARGMSKSRRAEVTAITDDVKLILKFDPQATIGVITFYSAQERLLRESINSILNDEQKDAVGIGTVDAFQGKEFDYVLLSGVRANSITDDEQKSVGFLVKPNRTCVAFSRAKKQLTVYGDAQTLNQIRCFKNLYEKCKDKKEGYYREY